MNKIQFDCKNKEHSMVKLAARVTLILTWWETNFINTLICTNTDTHWTFKYELNNINFAIVLNKFRLDFILC